MRRLHFLHVSKAGGTALKHALRPHLQCSAGRIVLHTHHTTIGDIPRGEAVFFVLRDPIGRFMSGFNGTLRRGRPRYEDVWSEAEAAAFATFQHPNDLALALSSAREGLRAQAFAAMRSIFHLSHGYDGWLHHPDYVASRRDDIFWVGDMARLGADFEVLRTLLGLGQECRLPSDATEANIAHTTDRTVLDAAAISNLRLWYQRDFELFDYCVASFPPRAAATRRLKPTDAATPADAPAVVGALPRVFELARPFQHGKGLAWTVKLPAELAALPPSQRPALSLWENDRRLLPTNAMHVDICAEGAGAHAFWPEHLCFSTWDGGDPNSNGRAYAIRIEHPRISPELPALESRPAFGNDTGSGSAAARQPLPTPGAAESPEAVDEVVLEGLFAFDRGYAWTIVLPDELTSRPSASKALFFLWEDSRKLAPNNAMHAAIRDEGAGAHAFWPRYLCFSTSDGSDPNRNGRRYRVRVARPDRIPAPARVMPDAGSG